MKKIIVSMLAMAIILGGCGLANSIYLNYNFKSGIVLTTSVGSPMIDISEYCKNDVYGNVRESSTIQLIYSGKAGNIIRITYREFSNNLARPAFSQDLTYDLSESKRITFRSTVIEVKEATNSSITFVVLESPAYRYPSGSKIGGC
jgi:hypothetical protein